jgi:sugar lactone lactonase YvrE
VVDSFRTPESVLYDAAGDMYLVANINGSPFDKDDNGFISHVTPAGTVHALKWIDGASETVSLNAPKGMAIRGDTLFVADIDEVRLFDRRTGSPLGSWPVPGATFLNDLAVGPDGTLYVTDSGLRLSAGNFAPSGTDALYRLDAAGRATAVIRGDSLGRPNGITADSTGVTMVSFGSGEVYHVDPQGRRHPMPRPPRGQLDGVVRTEDGSLLISSWEDSSVVRVSPPSDQYTAVATGIPSPADIGYDTRRRRVLIPSFTGNRVLIRPLSRMEGGAAARP